MIQQREAPIEGANDSQAIPPTRTGDNIPTSTIVATETKTMGAVPFVFGGMALAIAVIFMITFILVR